MLSESACWALARLIHIRHVVVADCLVHEFVHEWHHSVAEPSPQNQHIGRRFCCLRHRPIMVPRAPVRARAKLGFDPPNQFVLSDGRHVVSPYISSKCRRGVGKFPIVTNRNVRQRAAWRELCRIIRHLGSGMERAGIICHPAIKNDSGGLWRVETVHQNKNRNTGQLFFGQIRTLELRNSARFVQTA